MGRLGTTAVGVFAALAMTLPGIGLAQSINDANDDEWNFSLTPYMFLPTTTTGTSVVGGISSDLDLDLRDVFDSLNLAASARFEAWRGDFGGIVDVYYTNIGGSATATLPGPAAATAKVDVTARQGRVQLLGAYRLMQGVYSDDGLRYRVDVGAGAQINLIDQTVDARVNIDIGPGPGFQRNLGGSEVWVEPVVMFRAATEISERWTLNARADIGGYGVGGDDLQWAVIAGVDYKPWERTSLKFGWSFYGIDFETERSDGTFGYDVFQMGPYAGLTYEF